MTVLVSRPEARELMVTGGLRAQSGSVSAAVKPLSGSQAVTTAVVQMKGDVESRSQEPEVRIRSLEPGVKIIQTCSHEKAVTLRSARLNSTATR
jgi:hypothetical protein